MTIPHAMLEFVTARDQRLMRRVNDWNAPKWVRIWVICATRGGDGWLWYAMGLAILLFGGVNRFAAAGAAGAAAGAASVLACPLSAAAGLPELQPANRTATKSAGNTTRWSSESFISGSVRR